jgi:hypothetical protein
MISHDHAIAGTTKGGLRETHFLPHNSLQSSTYAFGDNVVLIAARSRKLRPEHVSPQLSMTIDLQSLGMPLDQ